MAALWIIVAALGLSGLVLIAYGLRLQLIVRMSKEQGQLESRLKALSEKLQKATEVKTRVLDHKNQMLASRGEAAPNALDEEVGWCIEDYDWRLDDLDWTIDDLGWDIRDTKFEMDSRKNLESTSKATFWTVLGAALFSLTSLIVGMMAL